LEIASVHHDAPIGGGKIVGFPKDVVHAVDQIEGRARAKRRDRAESEETGQQKSGMGHGNGG